MKILHRFIDCLLDIETAIIRRKAARQAARAAVRMALRGCRV
jgi:hypothetical protein